MVILVIIVLPNGNKIVGLESALSRFGVVPELWHGMDIFSNRYLNAVCSFLSFCDRRW